MRAPCHNTSTTKICRWCPQPFGFDQVLVPATQQFINRCLGFPTCSHRVSNLSTQRPLKTQTEIMVQEDDDGTTPTPTPTPSPSTVPVTRTTDDGRLIVEVGELGLIEIPSQSVTLNEDGCGALGCVEENTRVSRGYETARWVVSCVRIYDECYTVKLPVTVSGRNNC